MERLGSRSEKIEAHGLREVFASFLKNEAMGGIVLFFAALLAIIVANSPLSEHYFNFWHIKLGVEAQGLIHAFPNAEWLESLSAHSLGFSAEDGSFFVGFSIHQWISDVLMSIFFLMVGLEIKREVVAGELASFKKAIFPALAALGGMIVPGIIYFSLNASTPSVHGFGIPMATDIAFALGVIMLLKSRVPMALKVFLVTLAVVDDLGAIVVIAIFYANGLHLGWLFLAILLLCVLIGLNKFGIKSLTPYLCVGLLLWFAVHYSGIHATISAVALAFCIPVRPKISFAEFAPLVKDTADKFDEDKDNKGTQKFLSDSQIASLRAIKDSLKSVQSPLGRLERGLQPWAAFVIMPLFGFANAGVSLSGADMDFSHILSVDKIFLGVVLGLLIGKPLGIFAITFASEKLGIAARPSGISWSQILGAGILGGIGFTMSMFVSDLAFKGTEHFEIATNISKVAILSGSILSGIVGAVFLILVSKVKKNP
ncbi:Na+/H+ antiporter NhaA [Helicobacter sp. T3_23-1059]